MHLLVLSASLRYAQCGDRRANAVVVQKRCCASSISFACFSPARSLHKTYGCGFAAGSAIQSLALRASEATEIEEPPPQSRYLISIASDIKESEAFEHLRLQKNLRSSKKNSVLSKKAAAFKKPKVF